MTKEQALNSARLFLLQVYDEDANLWARVNLTFKDENTGYLCKCLNEAIEDAKQMHGKYLVVDDNDNILFDTMLGISFKI